MKNNNILIYGGSFNPPIKSHIQLAKQVMNKIDSLEKLIFVPVSTKYQKKGLAEDMHRYSMLKIICDKEKYMEVSDIEMKSKKQLYTIETLDYFKKTYKEYNIFFIMGTDNLREFINWKKPDEILKKYKLIVLERDNDSIEEIIENNKLLKENRESIIKIEGINRINLSSTIIREIIKKGEQVEEFIDKDVLKYIKDNKLYM